jgi:hypothetical protein
MAKFGDKSFFNCKACNLLPAVFDDDPDPSPEIEVMTHGFEESGAEERGGCDGCRRDVGGTGSKVMVCEGYTQTEHFNYSFCFGGVVSGDLGAADTR